LVRYLPLKYGENSTIYLVLSSNTTEIYNLLIQTYASGGEVYPEQQEVQIGGMYNEQIPLNVTAESNNVTIYVNVIDQQTGQVLYSLNETYSVSQGSSVALPSSELIFWILVVLAIIIIAAVLMESRRGGKKEKEKAEE